MPKKNLTDEERKAIGARLKAGRLKKELEARRAMREPTPVGEPEEVSPDPVVSPVSKAPEGVDQSELLQVVQALQREVAELKAKNPQVATALATALATATPDQKIEEVARMQGVNVATVGKDGIQGVHFKYSTQKEHYPDPTQRLLSLPELSRFAMSENFIFKWEVDGIEYEKHGITYAEPRFMVALFRRIFDENGQDTGKAALVNRQYQHEDQLTTRMAAIKLGILDKFENFDDLMTEIRFMRFRQWLLDLFTPPKITTFKNKPTTQVISGKVVEVYDTEALTDAQGAADKISGLSEQAGVGNIRI